MATLKRRHDSSLCDAYERGDPVAGFETAERVADEMALMSWLHQYTDYPRAIDGCYDRGSRNAVKARAKYRPPTVWPWMEPTFRFANPGMSRQVRSNGKVVFVPKGDASRAFEL